MRHSNTSQTTHASTVCGNTARCRARLSRKSLFCSLYVFMRFSGTWASSFINGEMESHTRAATFCSTTRTVLVPYWRTWKVNFHLRDDMFVSAAHYKPPRKIKIHFDAQYSFLEYVFTCQVMSLWLSATIGYLNQSQTLAKTMFSNIAR